MPDQRMSEREAVPGSRWALDGVIYVLLPATVSSAPYTIPAVIEEGARRGSRVDLKVADFDRMLDLRGDDA